MHAAIRAGPVMRPRPRGGCYCSRCRVFGLRGQGGGGGGAEEEGEGKTGGRGWGWRGREEGGEGRGLGAVGLGPPLAEASEGGDSSGIWENRLMPGERACFEGPGSNPDWLLAVSARQPFAP